MSEFFKSLKNILPDIAAEAKRQALQGTMEVASGLFNQNAFVPYGPGQYTPSHEQAKGPHEQEHEQERDRGGRE